MTQQELALADERAWSRSYAHSVARPLPTPQRRRQLRRPPSRTNDNSTSVSDVIVTVNKRAENVEDVPVAVTAFTPEQRDLQGVVSIFDMTRAVPSFEYSTTLDPQRSSAASAVTPTPPAPRPASRSISTASTRHPTYGLDRAPILSGTFEADAGPQGTLFGRNSIGGVLQQNSVHATDKFQTQVWTSRYNDHQRYQRSRHHRRVRSPRATSNFKLLVGADVVSQKKGYFHNPGHRPGRFRWPDQRTAVLQHVRFQVGQCPGRLLED